MNLLFFHNLLFGNGLADFIFIWTFLIGLPLSWYLVYRGARSFFHEPRWIVFLIVMVVLGVPLSLYGLTTSFNLFGMALPTVPFGLLAGWPVLFINGGLHSLFVEGIEMVAGCVVNLIASYGLIDWLFLKRRAWYR